MCVCVAADAPRADAAPAGPGGPRLRRYDTPYYVVHTDLPPDGAAEAVVRMAKLGDELRRRTRALGFRGRIEERLPFYLYARHADYVAAARAPPESAGVFLGDRLVAAAVDPRGSSAWHVIQHEAFHQFAAAAPGTEMPPWLNEGLGEYFGEALFTGDGYVTGAVPAWRLKRVRRSLEAGAFEPLTAFAATSQEQWNRKMTLAGYDHAWSLVQFLLHADRGKHQQRVVRYVEALGSGIPPAAAWDAAFSGLTGMGQEWRRYWLGLPEAGTTTVSNEATVATLTSFLARAAAAGQRFDSFDAFTRAARAGTVRSHREDWLPPSLLLRALDSLPKGARFSIQGRGAGTTLLAQFPDQSAWAGTFALIDDRVAAVTVAPAQRVPPNPEP
jgi:hypothetical protein